MPHDDPSSFAPFARRLTRGYVVLAVALICVVVATTSAFAFILYVGASNEATTAFAQRAAQRAAAYEDRHEAIESYAAPLVAAVQRGRIHVLVYDRAHRLLAGTPAAPGRVARAAAALLGLHSVVTPLTGGSIVIAPDLQGFAALLRRYLLLVLPVGALAVIVAWLVGRRITGRAIKPLRDVSLALRRIAAGDFTPAPLLAGNSELRDLTTAYNDVAYRLTASTAQRERDELQMRQFIADAGHELRTPLTIVMGYLDVLAQGMVQDPGGIAHAHDTMLAESRRMRAVIDKLILLARLERPAGPRIERLDAAALVRQAAGALAPLAGTRIQVTAEQPAFAGADETELYEAIENVIENALRYAPESPIDVGVYARDGSVKVIVGDEGPGMDAQDIEHAFDRFYRGSARGAAEGSGLGLAIAKRAVERSGGAISIESGPGTGTRVTLTLRGADP